MKYRQGTLSYCRAKCSCVTWKDLYTPSRMATDGTTTMNLVKPYRRFSSKYFIYNSAKLSDVRQFAASANIEVMIINIDAFKKAENIINQAISTLARNPFSLDTENRRT